METILAAITGAVIATLIGPWWMQWRQDRTIRRSIRNYVLLYCKTAQNMWDKDGADVNLEEFSVSVDRHAATTERTEKHTPFVTYSEYEQLTYEKILPLFANIKTVKTGQLKAIMEFIFFEDLAKAYAKDLRSEQVRHELTQERKAQLWTRHKKSIRSGN